MQYLYCIPEGEVSIVAFKKIKFVNDKRNYEFKLELLNHQKILFLYFLKDFQKNILCILFEKLG